MALDRLEVARGSPEGRPDVASTSPQQSRVTNGADIAIEANIDVRMPWPRRFKDLYHRHLSDLGGLDATSEAQQSLCRRATVMEIELERIEAKLAVQSNPSDKTIDLYQRTAGGLRRLLESRGSKRVARDVSPSLNKLMDEAKATRGAGMRHP
jgi:hypothetical protein